ncbi:hypothetical protein CLOSTASPAR_03219 [[Clostridium] asparagiforme DSM 15981]|uniref:Uncharacterized protein n=1 Tax=[Clostridium] asparagiforme DSM 15981 TaxID=518636 RepID=C0D1T1_9FIRM|nr:hypothetical protein CLOSTASPAR_03219 [[Clostridium] asparagiforme DSM 15981]
MFQKIHDFPLFFTIFPILGYQKRQGALALPFERLQWSATQSAGDCLIAMGR